MLNRRYHSLTLNECNGDFSPSTPPASAVLVTITAVWRRLNILSPVQAFVLASVSAALIALAMAMASVSRDQTSIVRISFRPDALNAYITFSPIFIGVVLALLGYYHQGRLGFVLNVAAGFVLAWIIAVCGILCFISIGPHFGGVWLSTVAYALCVVLVYLLIARLHLRAARSPWMRDAQRRLHLLPSGTR